MQACLWGPKLPGLCGSTWIKGLTGQPDPESKRRFQVGVPGTRKSRPACFEKSFGTRVACYLHVLVCKIAFGTGWACALYARRSSTHIWPAIICSTSKPATANFQDGVRHPRADFGTPACFGESSSRNLHSHFGGTKFSNSYEGGKAAGGGSH